MVYLKLEENQDKFLQKYQKFPNAMKKILFQSKCRKGKFKIQKMNQLECIYLPIVNQKMFQKLKILSNIRCWNNLCISENLRENTAFLDFAQKNSLRIMDGSWLLKNMVDYVLEYIVEMKNEFMGNQEVSILCHTLDETIAEKIKEISAKVKVCNILTTQTKEFQKLEEEIYQANGVLINVSKNFKKSLNKSSMVVNFDFDKNDLKKCTFTKTEYMIQIHSQNCLHKKDFAGTNIVGFGLDMPEKYKEYQRELEGFSTRILYESFLYKRTSYKNIKKELVEDDAQILYLQDENYKIIKKPNLILPKTLDKIMI